MPDRFKNSRRMLYGVLAFVAVIVSISLYMLGKDAAVILTTTLPVMLALPGAWAKIVNDAETKEPK